MPEINSASSEFELLDNDEGISQLGLIEPEKDIDRLTQTSKDYFISKGAQLLSDLLCTENLEQYIENIKQNNLYEAMDLDKLREQYQKEHHSYLSTLVNLSGTIKQIYKDYVSGATNKEYSTARNNYLTAIVSLMWSIHNKAKKDKDQELNRGSFKIIDPEAKLYNFLSQYVSFAASIQPSTNGLLGFFNGNDFAYSRTPTLGLSSHYKADYKQYGIDLRFKGGDHYALPILPADHSHLLFGQVCINGETYTFLKFEEVGLGNFLEFINHGINYKNSGHKDPNQANTTFREKDIPQEVKDAYTCFCQEATIESLNGTETIHEMWNVIELYINQITAKQENIPENVKESIQKFIVAVTESHLADNMSIRNGQEIIIDLNNYVPTNITPATLAEAALAEEAEQASSSNSAYSALPTQLDTHIDENQQLQQELKTKPNDTTSWWTNITTNIINFVTEQLQNLKNLAIDGFNKLSNIFGFNSLPEEDLPEVSLESSQPTNTIAHNEEEPPISRQAAAKSIIFNPITARNALIAATVIGTCVVANQILPKKFK
jgi:hypothetical protein